MTVDNISQVLSTCLDPELNVDIVSLGLIQNITIDNQLVNIDLVFTSPSCPYADQIINDMRLKLSAAFPGVNIKINQLLEPAWDPSKMSAHAKRKLLIGK